MGTTAGTADFHVPIRERIAWALNDAANSAYALVMVTAVYAIYFSDVVVGRSKPGLGDALWGYAISSAMLVVAVTSPFLGGLADRRKWRKPLLALYTALGVAATAACSLVGPGMIVLGLVTVFLGNIALEGSVVFYDSLLPGICPPETLGRWSGIGWGLGYFGGMICLFLCIPLVDGGHVTTTFLLVSAWWLLFSVPIFLFVRDRAPERSVPRGGAWAQARSTFACILKSRDLVRFFIAYFFYTDGMATTFTFAALFATKTLHFETREVLTLLCVVQLSGAVGAILLGFVADRVGHARTIVATLVVWCGAILYTSVVASQREFWVLCVVVGFVMGATQSAGRGLLASIAPSEHASELFGFKAIAGKFSAVIGPILFGTVSAATGDQRKAVLAIGVLFVVGLVLMLTVDETRARDQLRLALATRLEPP